MAWMTSEGEGECIMDNIDILALLDYMLCSFRVSSRIFQLRGGPASHASQILYLITTLGKRLTTPFPCIAVAKGLVGETRIQ